MDWVTSDTHFRHANIIKYCKRPFASVEEMDEKLLENINSKVKKNDKLYIVGDFAWSRCTLSEIKAYRDKINCYHVELILGNHDIPDPTKVIQLNQKISDLRKIFTRVDHRIEINVQTPDNPKQRIILDHYAGRVFNQSHRASWLLYAHSHGQLPDDPKSLSFDVGVDCHNYCPINLEQVYEIMKKKEWVSPFDKWEKEGNLYRENSRLTPEHE